MHHIQHKQEWHSTINGIYRGSKPVLDLRFVELGKQVRYLHTGTIWLAGFTFSFCVTALILILFPALASA